MSLQPPLGGLAPPLQCNRLLRWPDESSYCGRPGEWHIMWDSSLENGIACGEHADEARSKWAFYAIHEYRTECSMPGAVFLTDENRCVVDEDGLGLSVEQAAEATA